MWLGHPCVQFYPLNCVCSWYFGKLKRLEAEKKLLQAVNDHGAFLIRDSESRRDDYSLSGKVLFCYVACVNSAMFYWCFLQWLVYFELLMCARQLCDSL